MMVAIEFISKIKPSSFALFIFIEHLVFNKPTLVSVIVFFLSCIICFFFVMKSVNRSIRCHLTAIVLVVFNSAVRK